MQFCDLRKQYGLYKDEIQKEINEVLDSAAFIEGPHVKDFEEKLAHYAGVKHAISCSSGTDALLLPLMAYDIQPGDEILCPAFTFIATASMIAFYNAIPVFVDVNPLTFNIDVNQIEEKITKKTKGIVAVSLYGQIADMDKVNEIANRHGLWVIEDAAQSFGATYKGKKSCSLSDVATTSFFPAKPLGGYGDGGAVFTNSDELSDKIAMLKNHGQEKRYYHKYIGINGRLDAIQAAVLGVKLKHFDKELELRQAVASRYTELLADIVDTPTLLEENTSAWAQFTIQVDQRDVIISKLKDKGIPTAVHYPVPLPQQEAFKYCVNLDEHFSVSERLSKRVLSLPMHAYLSVEEQEKVVKALKSAIGA